MSDTYFIRPEHVEPRHAVDCDLDHDCSCDDDQLGRHNAGDDVDDGGWLDTRDEQLEHLLVQLDTAVLANDLGAIRRAARLITARRTANGTIRSARAVACELLARG